MLTPEKFIILKRLFPEAVDTYIANQDNPRCKYEAIINAFSWSDTPQGHGYWSNIHRTVEKEYLRPVPKEHEQVIYIGDKPIILAKNLLKQLKS